MAEALSPQSASPSRRAKILQRTWVGGGLSLAVAALLFASSRSSDGAVVLHVGALLSLGLAFEIPRMGGLRACRVGLPLAAAVLLVWGLGGAGLEAGEEGSPRRGLVHWFGAALGAALLARAVLAIPRWAAVPERRRLPGEAGFLFLFALVGILAAGSLGSSRFEPLWLLLFAGLASLPSWVRGGAAERRSIAITAGLSLWVVVPLPALVRIWEDWGQGGLVALLVLSKIGDIAGYYVGNALGKSHPFPTISPGKTTAGCVASLVVGTLFGGVMVAAGALPSGALGLFGGLVAGAWVNLASQAGDLAESLVKRRSGVKDSGTWFGPSGGLLDLVDSLLFSVPAALVGWPLFLI